MSPDAQYMEKRNKAEQEKLQQKVQALTDADYKDIYEKGMNQKTFLTEPHNHLQCHPEFLAPF